MRKIVLPALFLAVTSLSFMSSEAQPSAALFRHIPPDADGVYQLDLGSIFSKIDYHNFFGTFSNLMPVQDREWWSDMQSSLESGVDLHSHVLVTQSNQYVPDSPRYLTMLVPLTDSGRFMTFIRSRIRPLLSYQNPGHAHVLTSSHTGVAWDDRLAVLVFRTPAPHLPGLYSIDVLHETNARKALAALRGSAASYFATDPIFIKAFSDDADAHIWNRHSAGYATLHEALRHITADNRLLLIGDLVKASREHSIGTLRAGGNKITYTHLRLTTAAENASLKRIINPPLSPALLASVPAGRLIGLATLHFDPNASLDSLTSLGILDSLTSHLQQEGLTARDITNAIRGDFLLLAYLQDPFPTATEQSPLAFFLVATVKDSAAFVRIATKLHLADAATPLSGDTVFHKPFNYYGVQRGLAVMSTTPNMTRGYFDHLKMSADLTSKLSSPSITDGAFSLELDTHALAQMFVARANDSTTDEMHAKANILNQLDGVSISTGFIRDSGIETKYQLTTADRNSNVLVTLLNLVVENYKMQQRR